LAVLRHLNVEKYDSNVDYLRHSGEQDEAWTDKFGQYRYGVMPRLKIGNVPMLELTGRLVTYLN
jgi:hypothetical protein